MDEALAELAEDGGERSEIIRAAILTARRVRRRDRLQAEARSVAADPADRAEAQAILADMESE